MDEVTARRNGHPRLDPSVLLPDVRLITAPPPSCH
jgi:hypothetical protein